MDDSLETTASDLPLESDAGQRSHHILWLLLSGVGIVLFSSALGQLCVTHAYSNSGYAWSPNDANQAAIVLRCLGGMLFAAGLVERLIFGLTVKGKLPS